MLDSSLISVSPSTVSLSAVSPYARTGWKVFSSQRVACGCITASGGRSFELVSEARPERVTLLLERPQIERPQLANQWLQRQYLQRQ